MSQTACTPCESVLSCSDSPLSTTGNVVEILTFTYAFVLGTFLLAAQLNGSSADIKRFGKAVAFLKPRIRRLQDTFQPLTDVTAEAAETMRDRRVGSEERRPRRTKQKSIKISTPDLQRLLWILNLFLAIRIIYGQKLENRNLM
jgi:hypothetical protein